MPYDTGSSRRTESSTGTHSTPVKGRGARRLGGCPSSVSVRLDFAGLHVSSEVSGKKPGDSRRTDIDDGVGHSVTTDDGLPSPPVATLSLATTPTASTRNRGIRWQVGRRRRQSFRWLARLTTCRREWPRPSASASQHPTPKRLRLCPPARRGGRAAEGSGLESRQRRLPGLPGSRSAGSA